jgi:hypothetical protein
VVAFPGFTMEKMEVANGSRWVRLHNLELDDLNKINRYALVLVRGHGIRISPEELDYISTLLDNKCTANFRNLFSYTRSRVDRKILFNRTWSDPEILPEDFLFHLDTETFFPRWKRLKAITAKRVFTRKEDPALPCWKAISISRTPTLNTPLN